MSFNCAYYLLNNFYQISVTAFAPSSTLSSTDAQSEWEKALNHLRRDGARAKEVRNLSLLFLISYSIHRLLMASSWPLLSPISARTILSFIFQMETFSQSANNFTPTLTFSAWAVRVAAPSPSRNLGTRLAAHLTTPPSNSIQ